MNALIFAAGLGTRLKPLTDTMPKALVPVGGKPLLQHVVEKLKSYGGTLNIVVNIHHFGQQIIDFIDENNAFGTNILISDERDQLLETGGGLKRALPLFPDHNPVLIHNVDILSNLNLKQLYERHLASDDIVATLVVSERQTTRYLLFDDEDRLVGWTNTATGEVRTPFSGLDPARCRRFAFSGIHIVSQSILPLMHGWEGKFPIIDFYLAICAKATIKADVETDLRLLDVGKLDSLDKAEAFL